MIAVIAVGSCWNGGHAPDFSGTEPTVADAHLFSRHMRSGFWTSASHRKDVGSVPVMLLRSELSLALTADASARQQQCACQSVMGGATDEATDISTARRHVL